MIKLEGLEGREFAHGSTDCYSAIRDFYDLNFEIELPDFARPDDWWDPDENGKSLNLYMDNFRAAGFELTHDHPRNWRPGDVILMAIRSEVANHGAVFLPNETIFHHLWGQRSIRESYNRPLFRDTTVAIVRHPKVDGEKLIEQSVIDARDLIPERIRKKLDEARQGVLDV